jgi:hypothetical protein
MERGKDRGDVYSIVIVYYTDASADENRVDYPSYVEICFYA